MIYIIDHEDSFTYNLAHLLDSIQPTIVTNYYDIDYKILDKSSMIVLSPGPGEPKDYPLTTKIYKSEPRDSASDQVGLGPCTS